jgi:glycosyltransferase involved in cell wall biosynthesis
LADSRKGPRAWKKVYHDWARRYAYHTLARLLERKTLARLDLVIANSHHVAKAVTDAYRLPSGRVRTIHYGFSFRWPEAGEETAKSAVPQVLFVGGNFQRKGLPTLLKAVARLKETLPSVELKVAGRNPSLERMRTLAAALGLKGQVEFLGAVRHDRLAHLYRRAWVVALPSEIEGFGIVLLEAMHFGLPTIGSTRGGSAELIGDGWNGFLVEPGDVDRLTERLLALLTRRELREEMGARGQAAARAFTLGRMLAQTQDAYGEAIRQRAGHG